jgi:exodeoxyribonuclease V alpha subunit
MRRTGKNATEKLECIVHFSKRIHPKTTVQDGDWQVCLVDIEKVIDGIPYMYRDVNLIGNMVAMTDKYNTSYRIIGILQPNERYGGMQYNVVYSQEVYVFDTYDKQVAFLNCILTQKQLNNLIKAYPQNPIKPLEDRDLNALTKVSGIGERTAYKLITRFESCRDKGKAYVELATYGITATMINKLVEHYESPDIAVAKIKENPYLLIEDVTGIGFSKADEIALKGGLDKFDWKRCKAYIIHYFRERASEGHSFVLYDELVDAVEQELEGMPYESIQEAMRNLEKEGKIWFKDTGDDILVALKYYYTLESNVAKHLKRLMEAPSNLDINEEEAMRRIGEQEAKQGWKFTEQQLEGIFTAMNNNVTIIRGYGGTGKSSCVTGLLACADEDYRFKQCALSGKASVNLTDITGQEGYTIHRLLEVDPITGRFNHNEYFPLLTDLVILDEGSMVDVALFESLIQAIPTGAKLIILGDTNQLESIGVGNILLDMIDSGEVPVVTFDKVHRQGAKSAIIGESIKIAQGQKPVGYGWEGTNVLGELKDLKYIGFTCDRDSKKPTIDLIMKEFKTLYNECKDISQIAVIVPTRERGTGCLPINILIQDYVLPPLEKRGFYCNCGGYDIYKGDKVINLKNARPRPNQAIVSAPIYNGNMGEVIEVGFDYLKVDFYNIGEVYIYKSHLENIALGYAITVHKSQGSTIPYTISAIDFSHFSMLTRQLVYTTMTRAKKKCVMIFETNALIKAINTNKITQKDTFLYYFLTGELEM